MSKTSKPRTRAVAALNSLLNQISAVTLKDIGLEGPVAGNEFTSEIDVLAHIEVFGRSHTLACQISNGSDSQDARSALEQLRTRIAYLPGRVTPVLILPVLSPEVQSLCDENHVGCLDLRGNGRLAVDEIFVSMRSLPRRAPRNADELSERGRSAMEPPVEESFLESVLRGFPPSADAVLPSRVVHSAGESRTR